MNKFIHLSLSNNLEDSKEIEHFVSRWNMLEQILYLFGFYVLATLHSIILLLLVLQQSITLGLHMHMTPALTNTHQIIPPHLWSKAGVTQISTPSGVRPYNSHSDSESKKNQIRTISLLLFCHHCLNFVSVIAVITQHVMMMLSFNQTSLASRWLKEGPTFWFSPLLLLFQHDIGT